MWQLCCLYLPGGEGGERRGVGQRFGLNLFPLSMRIRVPAGNRNPVIRADGEDQGEGLLTVCGGGGRPGGGTAAPRRVWVSVVADPVSARQGAEEEYPSPSPLLPSSPTWMPLIG